MIRRWLPIVCFVLPALLASATQGRDRDDIFDSSQTPTANPEANQIRSDADQAYQRGDYAQVVELADRLLTSYPADNPHVAYHLKASAKIELGRQSGSAKQIREGISEARQALAQAGNQYRWLYIPYIYGLTSLAEIEKRPEHAEMALKVVTPVLERPTGEGYSNDDKANLYYQRALAHTVRRELKAAVEDYSQAIQLTPQHLGAHIRRADALARLGQKPAALAAYDEAVTLFPNTLLVFNDRGTYRRATGDLDGAISDFTRALQIDPEFGVAFVNRGLCLAEQDSPQAAEGDFTEALKRKLDPGTQVLAYRLRAQARLSQGNAAGAIADYATPLKQYSGDATLYEERGFANFFKKDYAAAAADFARAIKLSPELTRAIPWQALALARSGKSSESEKLLADSSQLTPPPNPWVAKLCGYLSGSVTESDLLGAAASLDEAGKASRLCEARYFVGQKKLLADEKDGAAADFREALATRAYSLAAFRGARFELGTFTQN